MGSQESVSLDSEVGSYSDLFRPDSRLRAAEVARYVLDGHWTGRSLAGYLHQAADRNPAHVAAVSYAVEDRSRTELTYGELADLTERLRNGLTALGVGPGDCVSVMLPNRAEFGAMIFAILDIGAIYSGIPAAYGMREAAFMVGHTRSKVLVIPERFRNRDYIALATTLRSQSPGLKVIVLGHAPQREGWMTFDELTEMAPALAAAPLPERGRLAHIGFTSGTTSEPKGVMNTHDTLDTLLRCWVQHVGREALGSPLRNLIVSPVGHHTGFLWGVLLAAHLEGCGVYVDQWNAEFAAQVISDERVSMMLAAPTFLQDLIKLPSFDASSLAFVGLAGSPIPRSLPRLARERFGCFVCPAWGMTEIGIGISGSPNQPLDRVEATDGRPVAGTEVRVIASTERESDPEAEGDLQVRGAGMFIGYYERPDFTSAAFTDGWFETGDRAVRHRDGFVSLTGRSKDIIIRGGENIPVVEIESLIYQHPAVADVAMAGYPDERLGERACAVLVLKPSVGAPGLEDLNAFLISLGVSKHFLPERLEVVDRLPKTSSGKVRKVELRRWLVDGGTVPGDA